LPRRVSRPYPGAQEEIAMPFQCSICDEPSTRICVRCTKDACDNHLCERCLKCSDCCECEVALDAAPRRPPVVRAQTAPEADLTPQPEPSAFDEPPPASPTEAE
jgi:hypothetical protein